MSIKSFAFSALAVAAGVLSARQVDTAAIIWPAYQGEPRWSEELGIFKHGLGEWQNVYEGTPRFEGHYQPVVPYWGYERDDDPKAMARQIDAALAAGVNVFIYDWYWYAGRPFLENALNNGFLQAPNNERMKFYVMWANHHVTGLWDNKEADASLKTLKWSCFVTSDEFRTKLIPRFIEYFKKPNYYKIDGKPVFWLYNADDFYRGISGETDPRKGAKITADMIVRAKAELDCFRAEAKKAGFPGIHLQFHAGYLVTMWSEQTESRCPPIPGNDKPSVDDFAAYLGIDSFCSYNAPRPPEFSRPPETNHMEYALYAPHAVKKYDAIAELTNVPFFPTVSTGWDNNARYPANVTKKIIVNNTPELVEDFMRKCREHALAKTKGSKKLVLINAWNEWTEGESLMPDTKRGYGFLNACSRVFFENS